MWRRSDVAPFLRTLVDRAHKKSRRDHSSLVSDPRARDKSQGLRRRMEIVIVQRPPARRGRKLLGADRLVDDLAIPHRVDVRVHQAEDEGLAEAEAGLHGGDVAVARDGSAPSFAPLSTRPDCRRAATHVSPVRLMGRRSRLDGQAHLPTLQTCP